MFLKQESNAYPEANYGKSIAVNVKAKHSCIFIPGKIIFSFKRITSLFEYAAYQKHAIHKEYVVYLKSGARPMSGTPNILSVSRQKYLETVHFTIF